MARRKCVTAVLYGRQGFSFMARITALQVQKKNQDRVSVFLDGHFAFGLPAIVAATLKLDQILSDEEIEALKEQGAVEGAYNRALHYLSYRPRSCAEVIAYLQGRDVPESQISEITARLERAGLLDDAEFARYWVENRETFQPRGPRALRYELQARGLDERVIHQALASLDVADSAYRAAAKKARQLAGSDRDRFFRKLIEYLARRGFSYEVARETAERHWTESQKETL